VKALLASMPTGSKLISHITPQFPKVALPTYFEFMISRLGDIIETSSTVVGQ